MPNFVHNHWKLWIGLGAGVAIGACITMALQKLTSSLDNKLARLVSTIKQLQEDVHELSSRLQEAENVSQRKTESSGEEDDDEFVQALDPNGFEETGNWSQTRYEQLQVPDDDVTGADDAEGLFTQVDALMEGTDEEKQRALDILSRQQNQYSNEANFLWRYSKSNFQNASIQHAHGCEEKRRELVFKSVEIIREALVKGENIPQVHKWYAITLGSLGDFLGIQEKIKNGYTFKEHIEKAISLDPSDSSNYYLLGRWCYGVYMLTWVERKVAATLFATPPTSTVGEALDLFLKADTLTQKPWKENSLFVAKCYVEQRSFSSAAEWLQKARDIPSVSQDDKAAQTEVETLMSKYGRYAQ